MAGVENPEAEPEAPDRSRSPGLPHRRQTKDGTFLNKLVEDGLLVQITGSAETPFEATYALTEKGKHAAEYGEYEYEPKPRVTEPEAAVTTPPKCRKKR